ncbi:MAG: squalene/phytoene synthase family protein [Pseudooceanicola sp.]
MPSIDFDDDLTACAALVERGDPARFRTVMAAPVRARAVLFPIYAFNVEVSRAPWVTGEAMIAEMRLQWWRDALAEIAQGGKVRRHEVATPLSNVLTPADATALDDLVSARIWDCHRDAFDDEAALHRYLDQTSGVLMAVASRCLGGPERAARLAGFAQGVGNWLGALPALEAQGRVPMVDGTHDGIRRLAQAGLDAIEKARGRVAGPALPAFWPATGVARSLRAAVVNPANVAEGALAQPHRLALPMAVLTRRW